MTEHPYSLDELRPRPDRTPEARADAEMTVLKCKIAELEATLQGMTTSRDTWYERAQNAEREIYKMRRWKRKFFKGLFR